MHSVDGKMSTSQATALPSPTMAGITYQLPPSSPLCLPFITLLQAATTNQSQAEIRELKPICLLCTNQAPSLN